MTTLQTAPRRLIAAGLISAFGPVLVAAEHRVTPDDDLDTAFDQVAPGDVFVFADGKWKDVSLHIHAAGTADRARWGGRISTHAAPKGINKPAQGNALGSRGEREGSPERAKQC